MLRKFLALSLVAIALCALLGGAVMAAETSVYPGWSATKITNPTTMKMQQFPSNVWKDYDPDGIRPSWPGYQKRVGDRWNGYIWSLCCKEECIEGADNKDYLWAGTKRNPLYLLLWHFYEECMSEQVTLQAFDVFLRLLFNGNIPTGWNRSEKPYTKDFGAEIWRVELTSPIIWDEWSRVYKSSCDDWPHTMEEDKYIYNDTCGEGECADYYEWNFGCDLGYPCCHVYGADTCCGSPIQRIYFGSMACHVCTERPRVIGFNYVGGEDNFDTYFRDSEGTNEAIRAITTYACNDKKYMVIGSERRAIYIDNEPDSDHIHPDPCGNCGYTGCDPEGWCRIADEDDLGGSRSSGCGGDIWDMVQYNGYLYVVVAAEDGFRIYRGCPNTDHCKGECKCVWNWTPIVDDDGGWFESGMGQDFAFAAKLAVCGDSVLVGTQTDVFGVIEEMLDDEQYLEGMKRKVLEYADVEVDIDWEDEFSIIFRDNPELFEELLDIDVEWGEVGICFNLFLNDSLNEDNLLGWMLDQIVELARKAPARLYRFHKPKCKENKDKWHMLVGRGYGWEGGSQYFDYSSETGVLDGFGITAPNWFNTYIWDMLCCNNEFYVTTLDVRSILASLSEGWFDENSYIWDILAVHDSACPNHCNLTTKLQGVMAMVEGWVDDWANGDPAGFNMYYISNAGGTWDENEDFVEGADGVYPITRDGFDLGTGRGKFNIGAPAMACCDGRIFVGTANPFWGGQVWEVSGSGGAACDPYEVSEIKSGDLTIGRWELSFTTEDCRPEPGVCSFMAQEITSPDLQPALEGDVGTTFFTISIPDPLPENLGKMKVCLFWDDVAETQELGVWDGSGWTNLTPTTVPTDLKGYAYGICYEFNNPTLIADLKDDVIALAGSGAFGGSNGDDGEPQNGEDATGSSGSSGCNAGPFSAAALLILLPIGFFWKKF